MRLVFAGTPPFAAAALAALADAGHEIVCVLTQPDRPSGRGMKLTASAVKALAVQRALPVLQPQTLRDPSAQAPLADLAPDAMVVAAYGLLLPPSVLAIPRLGCLNIHASLLPRWRGAAPIQRALLAGDAETGISIMQMDVGLDTGPVWARRALPIAADETAGTLLERLSALGAGMIVEVLAGRGCPPAPVPQPAEGVTYAYKIEKREAAIDFGAAAADIERQVRAFDPVPGAFCAYGGVLLKVWRARVDTLPVPGGTPPGTVLALDEQGLAIACGIGSLRLHEVQRAGGRRQEAAVFARAAGLLPGHVLDGGSSVPALAVPERVLPGSTA
ncbi:MAG: methionyl-tRNA formyltransferase [bacterium]|jgi:methionyl-tRNA formyltransferase|nr:methionyl-tRNA formyltransferase [Betaproteobacteria bacterium]